MVRITVKLFQAVVEHSDSINQSYANDKARVHADHYLKIWLNLRFQVRCQYSRDLPRLQYQCEGFKKPLNNSQSLSTLVIHHGVYITSLVDLRWFLQLSACLPSRNCQQVFVFLTWDVGGLNIRIWIFRVKKNTWVINMASFRSPALGYTIANSVSKETSVLLTIPCLLFVSMKMSGKLQLYHTADK